MQILAMKRDRAIARGSYGVYDNPKEELAEQFEKKQLAKSKYASQMICHSSHYTNQLNNPFLSY